MSLFISRSSRHRQPAFLPIFIFIFVNFFISLAANPLSFRINQFNLSSRNNIAYEGDAEPSSGVIELNSISLNLPCRVGRATYKEPLHLWNSATGSLADFSTHFTFTLDIGNKDSNFSNGFAFFLAPVGYPIPPNSCGRTLGLLNSTTASSSEKAKNQIVIVEFDTSTNSFDPQGQGSHVGIDINQIASNVYTSWNVSSHLGMMANVWITYNATSHNLSVFWTYQENPNPLFLNTTNSSLSYGVDLQQILPEQVTIGFSGATGYAREWHTIHSWEFNSTLDSLNETETRNENKEEGTHEEGKKNKGKWKKKVFIGVAGVSLFVLMLGMAIYWLVLRRRIINRAHGNKGHSYDAASSINTDLEILALPRRFAYQELVAATNGFHDDTKLGQGGSGRVYKGIMQDLGCTVAVKRIIAESEGYEKVFINEVKVIRRIMHRNLVQFIGWCYEQGECLLVYAYMPNSSLDTHLFGKGSVLQWDSRYKIALGLASALHYLHEDAEQCVLHRDIKSANIMLDNDFNAKLGDFGIAKLVDPQLRTHHTTTGVVGTFGYMAPEYASGGRASKESDMFSFGVVALEITCGRRTYRDGEYHVSLFGWVWQLYLAGNLLHAADERLENNFDRKEMECLLMVGLWCTHPNSKKRLTAGQVMKVLQLEAELPELPEDMHDEPTPKALLQEADTASLLSTTSSFTTTGR